MKYEIPDIRYVKLNKKDIIRTSAPDWDLPEVPVSIHKKPKINYDNGALRKSNFDTDSGVSETVE